jgi:hypothetical protein
VAYWLHEKRRPLPNPERPSRPQRCAAFILAQPVWIGVTRIMGISMITAGKGD